MKRTVYLIIILGSFLKCADSQPTETDESYIQVSGIVVTDDSTLTLGDIVVNLEGSNILADTTSTEGNFLFLLEASGQYRLTINDSSYLPYDTTLSISKDTTILVKLSPLVLHDYFPLSIGNSWTYSIWWSQCSSCDFFIEGEIDWEIIDITERADTTLVHIEERVAAIERKLLWENNNWVWDTTYVSRIDTFYYNKDGENYLTQQTHDYFSSKTGGRLKFLTMWPFIDKEEIVLKNYLWDEPLDGELIVLDSFSQTVLILKKDVGIKSWRKINDSNGDSKGELSLIDYTILD